MGELARQHNFLHCAAAVGGSDLLPQTNDMPQAHYLSHIMVATAAAGFCFAADVVNADSVARQWNEQLLRAVQLDTPRPTVHARNLFHTSAAMYDAWSAYDPGSAGYLFNGSAIATDLSAARDESISYAAYDVLSARFINSPGADTTLAALRQQMQHLGYDPNAAMTPAAQLGRRVAARYLSYGQTDGSNESNGFADTSGYIPQNPPMVVDDAGTLLQDRDRWQPLTIEGQTQVFLTPHWGNVQPFAIQRTVSNGFYAQDLVSAPPASGTAQFKADALEVIRYTSWLDPDDGVTVNISPSAVGSSTLGTNDGAGHTVNPATGQPYADNVVKRGDWGRVLAEFWADGPNSTTPPGHWNEIANQVSDHPMLAKRIGGTGPVVDDLEWDVKLYFSLNAAVHDAAIGAWDAKRQVDYVRPISMIRDMASRGQASDPSLPSYDPLGLPLENGLSEVVTADSIASGRHEGFEVGDIVVQSWLGFDDPDGDGVAGVGWIDATHWLPYQAQDFVTPAFSGYVSGHSTFSRAAAEILASITGDAYFPGGIGEFFYEEDRGLNFENGPTEDVLLQWATYYDAADEAGLSRLFGGIHVFADDFDGRIIGDFVGREAWAEAQLYFTNTIPEPSSLSLIGLACLCLMRRRRM